MEATGDSLAEDLEEHLAIEHGEKSDADLIFENPINIEKLYDDFISRKTLRGVREFCDIYKVPMPKNYTFNSLKSHVKKEYAAQFRAIEKDRQLRKEENYQSPFDYYVVIDFECTCSADNSLKVQEIIEFPAVLVDAKRKVIVDHFQEYVKPLLFPKLSDFCVQFTGISQATVDKARSLPYVIALFRKWLARNGLDSTKKYLIVTDGRADIPQFLNLGLLINDVPFPHELRTYADLKMLFKKYNNNASAKFLDMLVHFELEFEGQQHCGLDDATNIAKMVMKMCSKKTPIIPTNRMVPAHFGETYHAKSVISTPPIPTVRTAFYYSRVNVSQFKSKMYIICDECENGSCEAANFFC